MTPAASVVIPSLNDASNNVHAHDFTQPITRDLLDTLAQLDSDMQSLIPATNANTTLLDTIKSKVAGLELGLRLLTTRVDDMPDPKAVHAPQHPEPPSTGDARQLVVQEVPAPTGDECLALTPPLEATRLAR